MKWPNFFRSKTAPSPVAAQVPLASTNVGGVRRIRQLPPDAQIAKTSGRLMQRMYEAALTTNLNSDQPISLTSSNAEILTSTIAVRSRARTTERNNPYGAAMVMDWMRNICGPDPFPLEMKVGNEDVNGKFTAETDTNKRIQDAWEEAGKPENCTPSGTISRRQMYWTAIASVCRDGGAIFRRWGPLNDIPEEFLKLPADQRYPATDTKFALEPIEIDRLDQNWARPKTPAGNKNEIQFGIEYNHWRRPINYHILTRHPGDIFGANWNVPKYREAVPARDIIAIYNIQTRPEQLVGISLMAPVIRLLHQLEQFDIAHVTAALTACCKSIWIEKAIPSAPDWTPDVLKEFDGGGNGEGSEDGNTGWAGDGWGGGQGQPYVNTTPGEMNLLPWGNKVVALEPRFPMESATPFKKDILRAVASASAVWYNQLAQDMESVNFASGRLGENSSRDIARMYQEHMIDMLARPHFETWLRYAMMSPVLGDLPMARYKEFCKAGVFHGRRWEYTNPMQDVQADILAVEAGLNSRSRIISESPRGGDAEEVNREQQADRESDKKHGLDFSSADVSKPTVEKGLPGQVDVNPLAKGDPAPADGVHISHNGTTEIPPGGAKGKSVDLDRLERLAGVFERLNRASDPYGDHDTLEQRAAKAEKMCQELQAKLASAAGEYPVRQESIPTPVSHSKRNGNGHLEATRR